jgi:TonB family protein
MKHFTIQLVDANRPTRQWSIWAEILTVGSDPRSALVLPAPAAHHVGTYGADATVPLPFGNLVVREDTQFHARLWDLARARIARSRLLEWREPGDRGRNARAGALAVVGGIFVFAVGAICLVGNHPPRPAPLAIEDFVLPIPPDPEATKPVEKEVVDVRTADGADVPIRDPNQGGPTESRTIAHPPASPAGVMAGSVLAQANADMGDMLGNDLDPNASNMIDVILAGKGGLRGANATGRAGDGDNRMEGVGGAGLGVGGRSGFGTGRGSIEGAMRAGINGHGAHGVATRGIVHPPKPTDVDVGGEAGSRSPESILRVIRTHVGGFRYTYEKALKERPDLGGKISLRFTIAPSGDITAIEVVSSSTGDADLDEQIKDKAKRMKFDQIEQGNVTVTYAFVLDRQ